MQVQAVAVCGPRYWPQTVTDEGSQSGVGGGGGVALAALYRTHALFVQRKSGALSYIDDPSGVRILLSTAFHKVTVCCLPFLTSCRAIGMICAMALTMPFRNACGAHTCLLC